MTVTIGGRECVRGIDVAMYQPNIDWAVVKQYRDFAVIKATEGNGYVDPYFTRHRDGARAAKLPLGAYHYLQTGNGVTQAQNFLRATNNYAGFDLPVAVDYEQHGVNSGIANAFVAEIERVIGKPWVGPTGQPVACMIYTGNYFNRSDRGPWAYMDLWVAAYTNRNYPNPGPEPQFLPVPGASAPWSQWSIWQCNGGDGRCPGVGGGNTPCDQNVATVEWFNRTLNRQTPPHPEEDDMPLSDEDVQKVAHAAALELIELVRTSDNGEAQYPEGAKFRAAVAAAVAAAGLKVDVDAAVLAAELEDRLGPDLAKAVADELAQRLGD